MKNLLKNPFISSLIAEAYIVLVVLLINRLDSAEVEETLFTPIAAISLLVLSVLVMGYLFLAQPIQMYLEGQKQDAVKHLLKAILFFAVLTIAGFIVFVL